MLNGRRYIRWLYEGEKESSGGKGGREEGIREATTPTQQDKFHTAIAIEI
jgi:hypothetical protein